jgi:ectoine hydroxylase-related dioxygenase (phytanoyl-CoA dioxygenase family)
LLPDRSPKSLTTWIPLSHATPLNSCMYIVPALLDPTYGTEAEDQWKFQYPSVRALPGGPGDFFIWNQAVLHWGSLSSPRAPESRVSMAFEFQRTDVPAFNQPLLPPLTILPFEARLQLIAKQVLQYRHMYELDPTVEKMALQLLG